MRARSDEGPEWLEEGDWPPAAVEANLADIAAMSRRLGLAGRIRRTLARWAQGGESPPLIVEVGCGRGDLAREIAHRLRRQGSRPRFLLIDRDPKVLACAREFLEGEPGFTFVLADARALPLREGAADFSLCVQLLHQFDPEEAGGVLAELDRVARRGLLVSDVRRSAVLHLLLTLLMKVWGSVLTRHDAPLSLRRAYTAGEARELARRAGLPHLRPRNLSPAHWGLLGRKGGPSTR